MCREQILVPLLLLLPVAVTAQQAQPNDRPPIIDMHMHAYPVVPGQDLDFFWLLDGMEPPTSTEQLMRASLAEMERFNIVKGWASGPIEVVAEWKSAAPDLILGAPIFMAVGSFPGVEELRAEYQAGRLDGLVDAKMADAEEVTLEAVNGRSFLVKVRDGVARLFIPYL